MNYEGINYESLYNDAISRLTAIAIKDARRQAEVDADKALFSSVGLLEAKHRSDELDVYVTFKGAHVAWVKAYREHYALALAVIQAQLALEDAKMDLEAAQAKLASVQ